MNFTLSSIARSARARTTQTASAPARKTCGCWPMNVCLCVCKEDGQMTGRDRDETNQMVLWQRQCMRFALQL